MGQQNMILLKKRSKGSFFEQIVTNSSGLELFGLLYFFRKKKYNSIEISNNTLRFIVKNKVTIYRKYREIQAITYNGVKESLELLGDGTYHTFSLKPFEITFDKGREINKMLSNLNQHSPIKT